MNDAYYTLSDAARRRDFDAQRRMYGQSSSTGNTMPGGGAFGDEDPFGEPNVPPGADEGAPSGGGAQGAYSWAWNHFTGQGSESTQRQEAEDAQFGDAFEEMMREEGVADPANQPTSRFWSMLGGVSGGALGFIVANMPGALAGAVAGNRLGAVRDARGKSVYAVFQVSASIDIGMGGSGDGGTRARTNVRRERNPP